MRPVTALAAAVAAAGLAVLLLAPDARRLAGEAVAQDAPPAADTAATPVATPAPARAEPPRDWRTLPGGAGPEWAPVRDLDGTLHLPVNDLARLLDATKFWRGDLRKLVLRIRDRRLQLTVDNPFVVLDDRTIRLDRPVRSRGGELWVPVALVDSLPADGGLPRLHYDPGRRVVLRVPEAGIVGSPQLIVLDGITRVTFPADRPGEVVVTNRSRAHFRVRLSGWFAGTLPTVFPPNSFVQDIRPIATAGGSAFEIRIAPEVRGFRLNPHPDEGRVTLSLFRQLDPDHERFAPEGPPGQRAVRVIVLDPGHGGADAGVRAGGVVEKDLTLRLARLLAGELQRRVGARVVLTRDDDRAVTAEERAERANRAGADLVLSLHFDGLPGGGARGATAYCPPATWAQRAQDESNAAILMLPWRDVALRHAVRARELSEAVLSALELRAQGPTRLREVLPNAMLGVNAPGILLECATLTHDGDRERLARGEGLADLAATIADGVEAYQRND